MLVIWSWCQFDIEILHIIKVFVLKKVPMALLSTVWKNVRWVYHILKSIQDSWFHLWFHDFTCEFACEIHDFMVLQFTFTYDFWISLEILWLHSWFDDFSVLSFINSLRFKMESINFDFMILWFQIVIIRDVISWFWLFVILIFQNAI